MSSKVLFVVYDNGSYDSVFPMGFGAIGAILKRDGHEINVWNQDMHHWPDDQLRTYLDKNKFDVVILSLIAGYYQYIKMKNLSKAINKSKQRPYYLTVPTSQLTRERLWILWSMRVFYCEYTLHINYHHPMKF